MLSRFSQVMGDIERDLGTKELSVLILRSLKDSFNGYSGETVESLVSQLGEIIQIFNSTDPKYAIVIYNVHRVYKAITEIVEGDNKHIYKEYKKQIEAAIDKLINEAERLRDLILQNAKTINVEGKIILLHDHSKTVQEVLLELKKNKQKFRVIVAEQDMDKTLRNIEFLTTSKIPFQVVPSHMLSNVEDDVDMCFFGALTMKSTYDFVVDTGTNGIISEFHLHKTPIYFFLSTNKFSLWEASKKETTKKYTHTRKHPLKKIHFERFKFSHDRVPLSSVDVIVTEEGIFDKEGIKEIYNQKFAEHAALLREIK